ncbi:MAG: lipid-A-disaccharide synthase [Vampirovibrionales bacterium]
MAPSFFDVSSAPCHWLISTGDPSADSHVAHTLETLWHTWPHARRPFPWLSVVAGEHVQAVLARYAIPHTLVATHEHLGAIGLGKGLSSLYHHVKLAQTLVKYVLQYPPTLVLLVDYGGFHLRLAQRFKQVCPQVPIHYYIPPQLWASRAGRLKHIQACVDKLYSIFPFEPRMYQAEGVDCTYVGHPLCQALEPYQALTFHRQPQASVMPRGIDSQQAQRTEFPESLRTLLKLKQTDTEHPPRALWAILPGSRSSEVKSFWPVLKAGILHHCQQTSPEQWPCIRVSLAQATLQSHLSFEGLPPALDIQVVEGQHATRSLLAVANVGVIKSGTATLEAALLGCPSVIVYQGHWLVALFARYFIRVPFLGLPNLLMYWQHTPPSLTSTQPLRALREASRQAPLFPEYLQEDFTPERWVKGVMTLLTQEEALHHQLHAFKALFYRQTTESSPLSLASVLQPFLEDACGVSSAPLG